MIGTAIIGGLTCLAIVTTVLVKPSVKVKKINIGLYWVVALLGAILLLAFKFVDFNKIIQGLTANNSINPLKIITLFISMTILSIFLDELGLFEYLANFALQRAKGSQYTTFFYLYAVVSVLTVFTSNDIIILTFTPFICHFCKNADINPLPYLFCEFIAANTWSMMLVIGNPTNIYLATSFNVTFFDYFKQMFIPTVFAGVVSLAVLLLVFRKSLKAQMNPRPMVVEIEDKGALIIGVIHLALCTILLAISSYINLEMWYLSLGFALSLFLFILIYSAIKKQKPKALGGCLKRAPYELIPFVISMFVIVLAFNECGITDIFAKVLGGKEDILIFGASSCFSANLVNNIPMSVLFGSIVERLGGSMMPAAYASIIGSNVGAFLTPIGALAGIMWSNILKEQKVEFSFLTFIKYGVVIAIPTLLSAIGGLYLSFIAFPCS